MANEQKYMDDIAFLRKYTRIIELSAQSDAKIAVAPAWQGRVMTSAVSGETGAGFGWVNRRFIEEGKLSEKMNNYGGEDRFWMGPEAGQFGLWFKKGEPFDGEHAKTPPGFNAKPFSVTSQGKRSVAMACAMDVTNYSGTKFSCAVKRTIRALTSDQAAEHLGNPMPDGVSMVAFESVNTLANVGQTAWDKASGLLSIWTLGQFKALETGRVVVPFVPGDEKTLGPRVTTDYFNKVGPDRCTIGEDNVLFACDANYISKIGISPARSKGVMGSYDPKNHVLIVVQFNQPGGAAKVPYVNSLWKIQSDPFGGDVINSYNDGPPADGSEQYGKFYELETSSPAAQLAPGQSITHAHRTFHFTGPADGLAEIAMKVLGVDVKKI